MLRILSLLLFSVLCFCSDVSAQLSSFNFDKIGIDQGLSQSTATKIIQDRDGYIWIGTRDGLNRYDGYSFTIFNHRQDDSASLADNIVNDIFEDRSGNIWIATTNGLSRYDKLKNSFINYRHMADPNSISGNEIYSITQDSRGQLWFSTMDNGLNKLETKPDGNYNETKFTHFNCIQSDSKTIISNSIWKIFFDRSGTGWIGTQNGLCRITADPSTPGQCAFDRFPSKSENGTAQRDVWNILQDRHGNLWLISFTGMLDVIPADDLAKPIDHVHIIHAGNLVNHITGESPTIMLSIMEDEEGYIWLGTDDYGILRFQPVFSGNELHFANLSRILSEANKNKSLSNNTVYSMFRDKAGSTWIGTNNGISIFHPNKENFNLYPLDYLFPDFSETPIAAIAETAGKIIFGSAGKGVLIYDTASPGKSFKLEDVCKSAKNLKSMNVNSLVVDLSGILWIGTTEGIFRFLVKNISEHMKTEIECVVPVPHRENSLYSQIIFSLQEDYEGKIWIGTGRGVNVFVPATNEMLKIPRIGSGNETTNDDIVRVLFEDSKHVMWLGTDNGLLWYDAANKKPVRTANAQLSRNVKINSIFESTDHTLWIGTNGNGLAYFNPSTNETKFYTVQNGFPNDVIEGIAPDYSGNLWLSTHKGLCKFSPRDLSVTNYDIHDGLLSNEFLPRASFMFNGRLFFGNTKGLNVFFPDSIRLNNYIPPITITDFRIFDKSVFSTDTVIRRKILEHEAITLPFKQNNFSFEFSALNFINSEKNKYKFKLQGYDPDWIHSDTRRFIGYTNLDPGTYVFKVKASNNDGVWNETGISYPITILPPFYKTWWFRTLLALTITIVLVLINRSRLRNLEIRKQREIAIHATQMKEQFLANMSHEIRTPLNAIVGMTRLLRDKSPKAEQVKYLDAITQSSDNLLVIVNDILDISKIEAGKVELEKIPFSLKSVIENVCHTFLLKVKEKNLELKVTVDDTVPEFVTGDPVRINQVIVNLVGNAIKFTEQGSVSIFCSGEVMQESPGKILARFSIADTGIGIAEENREKIFESFTQERSETTRRFGGTGLGLAITKKLIEMQGGEISLDSRVGEGTTFLFYIPYDRHDVSATAAEKKFSARLPKELLKNIRVLLVEDNFFNQMVAVDTLEQELEGVKVDVAVNGLEAVEKVRAGDYDIVLMDVQMPEMNGYDATRAIRKLATPKNKTRIIAMTASALKEEVKNCFDAGMDEFIAKPFTTEELLLKMSKVLKNSSS